MSDDIVTRLRDTAYEVDLCWQAAAEIERLRKLVDEWERTVQLAEKALWGPNS